MATFAALILAGTLFAGQEDDPRNQLTILARESTPFGKVFRHSIPGVGNPEWSDLYPVGIGGGLEYKGSFPYYGGRAGFYASLLVDVYGFDSGFSGLGSDVDLNPLVTLTLTGGPTYELSLGKGFFWNGRAGIGLAAYSGSDLQAPGGSMAFFDPSVSFAAEAGTRVGWGNRSVSIEIGVSYRYQGGPSLDDMSYGALSVLSFEVGVGLRF